MNKDSLLKMGRDTLHVVLHQAPVSAHGGPDYTYWILTGVLLAAIIFFGKNVFSKIRPKEYELDLSVFKIKGDIQYSTVGREIAWRIYVELKTRIVSNELEGDTGILREAIQSLYIAFGTLRETLKNAGSGLASESVVQGKFTVASLLLLIMNGHLRPFLSKWHPLLQEHEKTKPEQTAQYTHERNWERNAACRAELKELKKGLEQYVSALQDIAEGKTK